MKIQRRHPSSLHGGTRNCPEKFCDSKRNLEIEKQIDTVHSDPQRRSNQFVPLSECPRYPKSSLGSAKPRGTRNPYD